MKFVKHIIKKDRYLLSLISNLLNFSCKTYIYTRIDLYHTYYLVYIIQDNKWKIAFYTYYGLFKWFVIYFSLSNTFVVF